MADDHVYVWKKGKSYARWNEDEPTHDLKKATYFDDERTAQIQGASLAGEGYELVRVPRRTVTER